VLAVALLGYRRRMIVSSRRMVAALLLVISFAGVAGCGDDGDSTTTTREDVPRPSAPRPDPAARGDAQEYPGAFGTAKELCAVSASRRKVAEIAGSRSTRPEAIARAVARGYRPHLRREAYRGCLAGLRQRR
jgi:hypothetical protein